MTRINKLWCKLFGHRWRCIMMYTRCDQYGLAHLTVSGFICDRCKVTDRQRWDH